MKRILGILTIFTIILAGCGASSNQAVTISGSTSVEEFMTNTIAPAYESKTGNNIEYQSIGSTAGIKNAINGTTTFGTSSRELTSDEKNSGLTEDILAIDGIAIVVNPNNQVENISASDLVKIYTGQITNWKDLGGKDQEIQVVSREEGSGTRGAFEELLNIEGKVTTDATISDGNGNVASTVSQNDAAIGYISFETLYANNDKVKGLKLDGVEPTAVNVQAGKYKLSRPFIMVYLADSLTDQDRDFIKFLDENKASLAPEAGLIEATK